MERMSLSNVVQVILAIAGLTVTAASLIFIVWVWNGQRNAKLVEIGVSILRANPQKNSQISAARKWALNLIDANAGGVKFSSKAKDELLHNELRYYDTYTLHPVPLDIPPLPQGTNRRHTR